MFVYTPSPQGNEGKLKTYYCRGLFLCNLSPSLFLETLRTVLHLLGIWHSWLLKKYKTRFYAKVSLQSVK